MLTAKRFHRGRDGLTLIELLIVIGIMGVMLVPMVQAFTVSFNSITHSKNRQRASTLAKDCLSRMKSTVPFSDLPVSSGAVSCSGASGSNPFTFPSDDDFSYETNVERVSGSGEIDVRLIQMRVKFPSPYHGGDSCISGPDCNTWDISTMVSRR